MTRGKGMILRLLDFHFFIGNPRGRPVAPHQSLDDKLAEKNIEQQRNGQDNAGIAKALGSRHEERNDQESPPYRSAGSGVCKEHHYFVQHGAMNVGHTIENVFVRLSQCIKQSSLRFSGSNPQLFSIIIHEYKERCQYITYANPGDF